MKHKIITPEGNPAGYGNTLAEAIQSAAEAYDTTTEEIETALNREGPDSLVHIEGEPPTPQEIVSAVKDAKREGELLIHWGENGKFEAFRDLEQDDPDYTEEDLLRAAKNLLSTDHNRPIETVEDALCNIGSI